jgi:hypothetical protein
MRTITQKADELLARHAILCNGSMEKFLSGIRYLTEYSYDKEGEETVFNQEFHDLMLRLGIVDSLQSPEQRGALGQAYIIPTREMLKYCTKTPKN